MFDISKWISDNLRRVKMKVKDFSDSSDLEIMTENLGANNKKKVDPPVMKRPAISSTDLLAQFSG